MLDTGYEITPQVVLGPALVVAGAVIAWRAARRRPGWSGPHALTRLAGALYAAAVLAITLFPIAVARGRYADQTPWWDKVNPVPLITLDLSAVPNAVMFVPLGVLLPLVTSRVRSWRTAWGVGAAVSTAIELSQLLEYVVFRSGRSVDVDDVLANSLGALAGYLLLRAVLRAPGPARLARVLALPGSALAARRASAPW